MKVESAAHLADLLIQSSLVNRQRYETWLRERSQVAFSQAADLANALVADGLITCWQADKLLAGKPEAEVTTLQCVLASRTTG